MPGLRVPHIIRQNASGAAPSAWVVVDTETLPVKLEERRWQNVYRLSVAQYWRPARGSKREILERRRFKDRRDLLSWISDLPASKERLGIVAHNMDFDAQVLDIHCELRLLGWHITKAVLDKGKWVQRWAIAPESGDIRRASLLWIDLANFYPMPLRELAAWLGMQKWPLPAYEADDETWFRYCEHDVDIEFAALQRWLDFRKVHDLGYFAPTIAGQAFNAYRHAFMTKPIYVHVHPDVISLEKISNVGGRNEIFWRGRAPKKVFTQVDVTSFYGAVMYGTPYPVKQVGHYWRVSPERLRDLCERHSVIARVRIETDVPFAPKRTESGTVYPVGTFETVLCTPELLTALDSGSTKTAYEVVTYDSERIFDDYVMFFWSIREDAQRRGDVYTSELAKSFLTRLHGKLGQRIWALNTLATGLDSPDKIWTEYDLPDTCWYEYRVIAGRLERRSRELMGRDTLLAIPSHVNSYGRSRLWTMMMIAGLDHVYYVDTDSLIVDAEGERMLAPHYDPTCLGGLRVVSRSRDLYIRAPKWYKLGHKTRHGGIKDSAEVLSGDRFSQEEFRSMRWALRREYPCASIMDEVTISAPFRNLLTPHGLGHRVHPRVETLP